MKKTVVVTIMAVWCWLGIVSCTQAPLSTSIASIPAEFTISKERLMDKIKGGWAGQTIGCTYGGPMYSLSFVSDDPGAEDMDFAYTAISLNKTYRMGFNQATFNRLNPREDASVHFTETLVYSDAPKAVTHQ